MVDLEPLVAEEDLTRLRTLLEKHFNYTGSPVARGILEQWEDMPSKFVKIMPVDYKRALEKLKTE